MVRTERHATNKYEAVDDYGNEYTIIEYQEVGERRAIGKPVEWVKMGSITFRLDDGTPINRINDTTFKIATTDRVLRRVV
jgi:hypothetical protein